jgi:NADPH:quinone reductase-like Zn-dependent oxidoreductase
VLAVTSSGGKVEALRSLGADEVVLAAGQDFSQEVLALTRDEGVDVVIDTVGSPLLPASLRSLAQYGRMVVLGEVTGGTASINLAELIFRDIRILGSSGTTKRHIREVAHLVGEGRLRPVVSHTFPLEEADEAFNLVARGKALGRVVLTPQREG